jgi:hypothetical protein
MKFVFIFWFGTIIIIIIIVVVVVSGVRLSPLGTAATAGL